MKENSFNFLGKLYVWSIIFEPLLFFILIGQQVSGVGGNLSRLLQILVIFLLIVTTLAKREIRIRVPNPFSYQFRWYFAYLFLLIFSALYGLLSGAFESSIVLRSFETKNISLVSSVLNSAWIRPLFEYLILFYYFVYFVILPQYLLKSRKAIDYFFKVFFAMFFLSLFVGIIDLLLVLLVGYEWIPRHLSDFTHVGNRFHGLAGEPRDAFVYLILGICLIYLKEEWTGKFKGRIFWFLLIPLLALTTQSASGLMGLFFAFALIVVYLLPKLPIKYFLPTSILLIIISTILVNTTLNSTRLLLYIENIPGALIALQQNIELPPVIQTQIVNFYPVWIRWENLMDFNLLPLFLGTGPGTASIANGFFLPEGGVLNPHANIIRIAFEAGAIGVLLVIAAFTRPLKYLKLSKQGHNKVMLFMLLLLGVTFGHRSSAIYIFLGLVLLVFNYKNNLDVKKI